MNTTLVHLKGELSSVYDQLRVLEQEKLNSEADNKAIKKQLIEIEEKVQKDEDRKKKIQGFFVLEIYFILFSKAY